MLAFSFRTAIRSLLRTKRFAFTGLLVLTLGLVSALVVFSVLDAVLLRPGNYPHPESVFEIQAAQGKQAWDHASAETFRQLQARRDLFAESAAAGMGLFTVTNVPAPDQVFGLSVSGEYFQMLGARPLLGRLLDRRDERMNASPVAVLSYRGWKKLFAGDPRVAGRAVSIDGVSYTIAGVLPADFVVPGPYAGSMLWTPLRLSMAEINSGERNLQVVARLRAGVRPEQAQSAIAALAAAESASKPESEKVHLRAVQWRQTSDPDQWLVLSLAMGMTGGLLLIGCANLCSLILARGIRKRRDYAVSLALGGTRANLMLEAFCEMAVLVGTSLVLSIAIVWFALPLLRDALSMSVHGMPNLARMHLDGRAVVFGFGVASLCAFVCGLLPAWIATSFDAASGLRESGAKVAGSRPVRRFLRSVVALEGAISMLLLLTSLLLVRSLERLLTEDHGLRADHVLTMRLPTGAWRSHHPAEKDAKRQIAKYLDLLERAKAVRGLRAAALASSLPLSHTVVRTRLDAPGDMYSAADNTISPVSQSVTRDYFRAMGIPLLAGRSFQASDASSKVSAALVNEAFARAYFHGANPVGHVLRDPESKGTVQIVGMVKDSPHLDLAEKIDPEIYFDFEQQTFTPFLTGLVGRTFDKPEAAARDLRAALAFANAEQAVVHVASMQSLIRENTWQPRFSAWLFSAFAALALVLSALGIYGVVAYAAAASRREYGIRAALGADRASLFRLVAVQSAWPVAVGALLGVAGSYAASEWMRAILYKTGALDVVAVSAAIAIFLFVTIAATTGPALQAGRVDPAISLRDE